MVEAGGIEPPSENPSLRVPTRVAHVLVLTSGAPTGGIPLGEPEVKVHGRFTQALSPATLLFYVRVRLAGVIGRTWLH